jgi:hypothetical protein
MENLSRRAFLLFAFQVEFSKIFKKAVSFFSVGRGRWHCVLDPVHG